MAVFGEVVAVITMMLEKMRHGTYDWSGRIREADCMCVLFGKVAEGEAQLGELVGRRDGNKVARDNLFFLLHILLCSGQPFLQ